MNHLKIAPFRPHRLLWGGHTQTVLAAFNRGTTRGLHATRQHRVVLPDGDPLVLHDDASDDWRPGDPVALLVHGMCGCAQSSYMQRIASKLMVRGLRTFRLDLRGCGSGTGLARFPYHAGQSDDLQATAEYVSRIVPTSPVVAAGFSLGGNILLKWLGEHADALPLSIERAAAVNPPIDLESCTNHVGVVARGFYDRHFTRLLCRQAQATPHWHARTPLARASRMPRRITDFDELFTAPLGGFNSALDYYRQCSAAPFVSRIRVPTMILSAKDDPLIPPRIFRRLDRPDCVNLHIAEGGGHLGYIGRGGRDPDRYWMDWRVIDWLTATSAVPEMV